MLNEVDLVNMLKSVGKINAKDLSESEAQIMLQMQMYGDVELHKLNGKEFWVIPPTSGLADYEVVS